MEVDALNRPPGKDAGEINGYTDQEWTEYAYYLRQDLEDFMGVLARVCMGPHVSGHSERLPQPSGKHVACRRLINCCDRLAQVKVPPSAMR